MNVLKLNALYCQSRLLRDLSIITLLHDSGKGFRALRSTLHLLPKQVAGGEVGEPVLGYDLLALCALARARPAQDPHDGLLAKIDGRLENWKFTDFILIELQQACWLMSFVVVDRRIFLQGKEFTKEIVCMCSLSPSTGH